MKLMKEFRSEFLEIKDEWVYSVVIFFFLLVDTALNLEISSFVLVESFGMFR